MCLWPVASFLLSVYSCWCQQQKVDLVGAGAFWVSAVMSQMRERA